MGNIKDVCFKYYKDNENYVLEHINFTANPGETVGIIGGTGSGKSTLVHLIPRQPEYRTFIFYCPTCG